MELSQVLIFRQLQTFHQQWPWSTFSKQVFYVFIYASHTAECNDVMQHWQPDHCDLASTLKRSKDVGVIESNEIQSFNLPIPNQASLRTCKWQAWWGGFLTTYPLLHAWVPSRVLHINQITLTLTQRMDNTLNNIAGQVLTHLTPRSEKDLWSSAETRSGQCGQHKHLTPCYNFRWSARLMFPYDPWTPRHRLIVVIPYNLLDLRLCRVASDLHSWRQSRLISSRVKGWRSKSDREADVCFVSLESWQKVAMMKSQHNACGCVAGPSE